MPAYMCTFMAAIPVSAKMPIVLAMIFVALKILDKICFVQMYHKC